MSKDEVEKKRRERISEALRRYYQTDKGVVHRSNVSSIQRVRMSKYGEYLKATNNNNETKIDNDEKSKV